MNPHALLSQLDAGTERLTQTLASFSDADFNRRPSPEQWSAAQVAEHLLTLEKTAVRLLRGPVVTSTRPPDEKAALIKQVMEDDTPRQAPEAMRPSAQTHSKEALLAALKTEREKLKAAVAETDPSEACKALKHPGFGTLTRYEWLAFVVHHTERHRRQLERLATAGS